MALVQNEDFGIRASPYTSDARQQWVMVDTFFVDKMKRKSPTLPSGDSECIVVKQSNWLGA